MAFYFQQTSINRTENCFIRVLLIYLALNSDSDVHSYYCNYHYIYIPFDEHIVFLRDL